MSELLIVDDDPDPLPTTETVLYPINLETGLSYEGPGADETLLAERETADREKKAIGELTASANAILRLYDAVGHDEDCRVTVGNRMLRRRIVDTYPDSDRLVQSRIYFYVDTTDGKNYCRSWSEKSPEVNWCYQEERHEPADDVRRRLEEAFPWRKYDEAMKRSLGSRVLAKLRRRD